MEKKQLFETFEHFLDQNLDYAYRYAFTYMKNQQDAEDVVSDSVEKALRALTSLRDPALMKTWFLRIVINTAKNHLQRRARVLPVEDDLLEELAGPEEPPPDLDLDQILSVLTPDERVIIVLRFYEEYKIREIAEMLGLHESTVKKRLYRALRILKTRWEETICDDSKHNWMESMPAIH